MRKERNEFFRFVIKPLLISEEKVNDHHRCADEVIVEVVLEETQPDQGLDKNTHVFALFIPIALLHLRPKHSSPIPSRVCAHEQRAYPRRSLSGVYRIPRFYERMTQLRTLNNVLTGQAGDIRTRSAIVFAFDNCRALSLSGKRPGRNGSSRAAAENQQAKPFR